MSAHSSIRIITASIPATTVMVCCATPSGEVWHEVPAKYSASTRIECGTLGSMHVIEVLDRSGHLSLTSDPSIPESVERARGEFDLLQKAGYQFFRVLNSDKQPD